MRKKADFTDLLIVYSYLQWENDFSKKCLADLISQKPTKRFRKIAFK